MKRKPAVLALLGLILLAALLCGCSRSYAISVSDPALVESCPSRARAGETVTLRTLSVTDADLIVSVNGQVLAPREETVYEFTMPNGDAQIDLDLDTSSYPGA